MSNGVPHEVYVIASKRSDGSLPSEVKIHDDRIFFSREDAAEALDDFQPYMRDYFEIYTADLDITAVSHDTPFTLPSVDVEDSEDENQSSGQPSMASEDRAALYTDCKQAIVDWCKNNKSALDAEFSQPLSNSEYQDTCDVSNWLASSERDSTLDPDDDYDDVAGWCFDCEPFNDQLRGYVRLDDQWNVTHVVVQGE